MQPYCPCCDNTSWGRGGKLKLAVPVGLPAGWAHLVMSHPSPRLPRFARNDIERLRSRGKPSMSWRGAGATWQSQGGAVNGLRGSSGQYDAGAVRKPPFPYLRGVGGNTSMGDCCESLGVGQQSRSTESPLATSGDFWRPQETGIRSREMRPWSQELAAPGRGAASIISRSGSWRVFVSGLAGGLFLLFRWSRVDVALQYIRRTLLHIFHGPRSIGIPVPGVHGGFVRWRPIGEIGS